MIIGGAALNQTPLDWDNNLLNIKKAIERARDENVRLLCLPELCMTGYGCEDMFLHPWVSEKALELLPEVADWTENMGVTVGLPVWHQSQVYNALVFMHDRQILGLYAKQHLPKDGIHYEPRWFTEWPPGELSEIIIHGQAYPFGHWVLDFEGYKLSFEICEDAWVADQPLCHLNETPDIVLSPSASHFAFGKVERRQEIIRKNSEKFDCIYVYANQLGNEAGRVIYDGDVMIAQSGQMIATGSRLSFGDISVVSTEMDPKNVNHSQKNLSERIHSKNEEFPQAAGLALFDYMRKSRSGGFVLSLSGGADSSTITILIAEMAKRAIAELGFHEFARKLGLKASEKDYMKQLLTTAYQGTVNSSEDTLASAKNLAESVGATFYHWQIDDQVSGARKVIEEALGRPLSWDTDDLALQNIQARSRSPVIWMLANIRNAILLATSNRSEGAVGYTTMDGDTSGGLSPIAGVDKHFIREWLQYAEKELGYKALKYVNALQPTAELRPLSKTQTDEEDLMPYEILQYIERSFALERLSRAEIVQKLSDVHGAQKANEWVEKFFRLWRANQWKRERLAPSFHLDDYNLDPRSWFRFPILSGG